MPRPTGRSKADGSFDTDPIRARALWIVAALILVLAAGVSLVVSGLSG